jgi:hypothetical protein
LGLCEPDSVVHFEPAIDRPVASPTLQLHALWPERSAVSNGVAQLCGSALFARPRGWLVAEILSPAILDGLDEVLIKKLNCESKKLSCDKPQNIMSLARNFGAQA